MSTDRKGVGGGIWRHDLLAYIKSEVYGTLVDDTTMILLLEISDRKFNCWLIPGMIPGDMGLVQIKSDTDADSESE